MKEAREREDVIGKIRRLLALAERTTFQGEAEAALLQAQALLVQHDLSARDLEEVETEQRVTDTAIDASGRMASWRGWLAQVIGDNFRVQAYQTRMRHGLTRLRFLGLAGDVEVAVAVYQAAAAAAERLAEAYVSRERATAWGPLGRGEASQIRSSFIGGFIYGLRDKFREQVDKQKWGLVLVQSEAVQEAVKALHLGTGRTSQANYHGDLEARAAGYTCGRSFEYAAQTGPGVLEA